MARFEARIVCPDDGEPVRFRKRQRAKQRGVDQAEDGGASPDSKREREHSHGGEAGVLQQLAEGEFEVVHGRGKYSVISGQYSVGGGVSRRIVLLAI